MDRSQITPESLPVLEPEASMRAGRSPVSNWFVLFVAIKAFAVIEAIPGLVFGGLLYHASLNQKVAPFWWGWLCVLFLGLALTSDVIGRIGCWVLSYRTAGWPWMGLSVGCQSIGVGAAVIQLFKDYSTPIEPGFLQAGFCQGAAAMLFVTGIHRLARESGWGELETRAFRLLKKLIYAAGGIQLLGGVLVCAFICVLFGIFGGPLIVVAYFFFAVGAVLGAVVAVLIVIVEFQYLATMWRLISEMRRSIAAAEDKQLR